MRNGKRVGTPRKTKWQFHESYPFVFCEREDVKAVRKKPNVVVKALEMKTNEDRLNKLTAVRRLSILSLVHSSKEKMSFV